MCHYGLGFRPKEQAGFLAWSLWLSLCQRRERTCHLDWSFSSSPRVLLPLRRAVRLVLALWPLLTLPGGGGGVLTFGLWNIFSFFLFLQPHLHKIVNSSMELAQTAKEPYNYFLLLRALFRSIGGGSHDLLYQEFLPLLPNLLQGQFKYPSPPPPPLLGFPMYTFPLERSL